MDKRAFLEKYKADIVAEPSGRTYEELQTDKIRKFMLVDSIMKKEVN